MLDNLILNEVFSYEVFKIKCLGFEHNYKFSIFGRSQPILRPADSRGDKEDRLKEEWTETLQKNRGLIAENKQ